MLPGVPLPGVASMAKEERGVGAGRGKGLRILKNDMISS